MSPGKAALLCAILSSAAGSGAERRHTGPDSRRETDGPRDPDLEPGFPVQTFETAGGYTSGQGIHTLVANIDDDPQKEIVVTALANGPLYAWNHDGTPVPGWPSGTFWGAGYAAAGRLSPGENLQVFAGYYSGKWAAWTYPAALMPGWPLQASNYVALPPTLADIDGDGIDEIFVEGQDNCLHGFNAAAETLPGWPFCWVSGQSRSTPAVADLDGDGDLEIVTAGDPSSGTSLLYALHHDGQVVDGFPVVIEDAAIVTFAVVGDLDADGTPEIVIVKQAPVPTFRSQVRVLTHDGREVWTVQLQGRAYWTTAPALADLDRDGRLEIVVATDNSLEVLNARGKPVSGWPKLWEQYTSLGSSSPVIGDVTGDGAPDIVLTLMTSGIGNDGAVHVYDAHGNMHPHFPKALPSESGAVPAIADVDLDGRNEIVITGQTWDGFTGWYDKVWVYDLGNGPHGRILWGQLMGGPRHQGRLLQPID